MDCTLIETRVRSWDPVDGGDTDELQAVFCADEMRREDRGVAVGVEQCTRTHKSKLQIIYISCALPFFLPIYCK